MAGGIPNAFSIGTKVTPATAAANYQSGAATKGAKWATNYLHSKRDPFQAAHDAAATWLANINQSGTAGYQAGLNRVNKAQVAQFVSQHGPAVYAAGIANKGAVRYQAAAASLIPAIQQAAHNLPPRGNDSQNEERMILMRRAMKAMRGQHRAK
ncbi:MAG TPA: hypothetical protein VKH81_03885 [Candidatus Angelobacter sp.]|nr:hypothetical protein [Candidatus Angelobacter sp.]